MTIVNRLFSVLAPHECVFCGFEGHVFCSACGMSEITPLPNRCAHCQVISRGSITCRGCTVYIGARSVWVGTDYNEAAKYIMHEMKNRHTRHAALDIARYLHETMPFFAGTTVVVPAPTASRRVRMRGFDHTKLIAREFARLRGLEYKTYLQRLGQSRQVGAPRDARRRQLQNAFLVPHPESVDGQQVLLVDDVLTTGATITAATRALKAAGAVSVDALVFAQKI